jgi:putative mRNA 3-end processing factor
VPVSWRDGVHLTGTPIWCDARRRRDICFVSSADRTGRSGHGQLIATAATLALIGARDKGHLAVPLRQRFTLGTVRLELIPSGRGLGAAALHADITGRTVLYAGAVRTTVGGAGEAAEVRTSDAVVVAAPYGEPEHRFPPLTTAIDAAIAWTRAQLAGGRRPVLLVDALLDGLEVASRLAAEGLAVAGARVLRDAAHRIADLVPAIAAPGREPRAIVWLDADRDGLARSLGDRPFATALVSARASAGVTGHDAGFAWATAADRPQLLAWIEATGARDVFVTGPCAEAIVAALGARARVIGPPHQMSLFPREAVP